MAEAEYLTDTITLYEGSCEDVLPLFAGSKVHAIISDPPYGMNLNTDNRRFTGGSKPKQRSSGIGTGGGCGVIGDDMPFDPSPWIEFPKAVLWGCNHFAARLPVGTTLVWIKRFDDAFGAFLSDAELAWMRGGHGVYCRRDTSNNAISNSRTHPCQKPVGLMRWCIKKAKVLAEETIVDPFAGSGTTAVAAMLESRKCIVIERDPGYCEVIRKRVRDASGVAPGTLFHGVGSLFDN